MKPRLKTLAIALIVALASPVAAAAPEIVAGETGLAVVLAGHQMTVPPPVWTVPSAEPVEQATTLFTELAPGVDSLVLLPTGETAVTWKQLMGILAVNRVGYTAVVQLKSVVDPITQACAEDELYATSFGGGERGAVLLMCGRYRLGTPGAPSRCGGGIILATVLESTLGAAKIYHEWCTDAFDVTKREEWPVTADDLGRFADLLMTVSSFVPVAPTGGG